MKNKYGIGFFAAAIILMLVLTGAYQLTYYKARERAALEPERKKRLLRLKHLMKQWLQRGKLLKRMLTT